MLEAFADGLQGSALSQMLRASIWLYPLVNTGHVVGIALLFGGIVPLDLRLAGCWRGVPIDQLARISIPVAMFGLVLAASTGALLFATRPLDYVGEPLFGFKMALVAAALLNALALRRFGRLAASAAPRPAWRTAGIVSIVLWLGVIACGRLIGYR